MSNPEASGAWQASSFGIWTSFSVAKSSETRLSGTQSSWTPTLELSLSWEARPSTTSEERSPDTSSKLNLSHEDLDAALDYLMDPITGSAARNEKVEGIVTIHVDAAFLTGTTEFTRRVTESLRKDFKVGSEDTNDRE